MFTEFFFAFVLAETYFLNPWAHRVSWIDYYTSNVKKPKSLHLNIQVGQGTEHDNVLVCFSFRVEIFDAHVQYV
jgi:hypothetical protein